MIKSMIKNMIKNIIKNIINKYKTITTLYYNSRKSHII